MRRRLRREQALHTQQSARSRPCSKLSNRGAEKFWLETFMGDRVDEKNFAEFLGEGVETSLSVLALGLLATPLLEWAAAFRDRTVATGDVTVYEPPHKNPYDGKSEGGCFTKCAKGSAGNALRMLAFWFERGPRTTPYCF